MLYVVGLLTAVDLIRLVVLWFFDCMLYAVDFAGFAFAGLVCS